MTPFEVRQPITPEEWANYYALRSERLRLPWGAPPESPEEPGEAESVHAAAFLPDAQAIGSGRLLFPAPDFAQIRSMAVHPTHEGSGVGRAIVRYLESKALEHGIHRVELNARDNALGFYLKLGYENLRPTDPYLGIPHFRMGRTL